MFRSSMHRDFLGQRYEVGDYVYWYKLTNGKKLPTLGQVIKFTENNSIILSVIKCEKACEEKGTVRLVYPGRAVILRDGSHQYIFKEIVARK